MRDNKTAADIDKIQGKTDKQTLTTDADRQSEQYFFPALTDSLLSAFSGKGATVAAVTAAVKNAVSVDTLSNNLAEVFRISKEDAVKVLEVNGFRELIEQSRLKNTGANDSRPSTLVLSDGGKTKNPYSKLFEIESSPGLQEPVALGEALKNTLEGLFDTLAATMQNDTLAGLYRGDVMGYYNDFMTDMAPVIMDYINTNFDGGRPMYMVTTGIGANEQFTHFIADVNNKNKDRRLDWLVIDSPRKLALLPPDATVQNTLFVEFSRSSLTEETVKTHEYTPREAKRIVFSNSGPLKQLAERDKNLILHFPDQVSGRFGRNKTPMLLAPMLIAGMDTAQYWKDIDAAIKVFDLSDTNSLPFVLAKFLVVHQKEHLKNFIYFGANDDALGLLADEFIQFWNEGVNKTGNDFLISRFFGLPRDSHMNIEGILGNRATKMGVFLLRTDLRAQNRHPMVRAEIDPINPAHQGLQFGDEEAVLAMANYKRFSEIMPTLLIKVPMAPDLRHSAVLGQLFADVTYVYSRILGIDPGSNPEVKAVRERSAALLAEAAGRLREYGPTAENLF
ncbi:hypothetical protein IZU99_02945 [Oscillospiraceae bacterium CM]|nr:hypothetical protein IZU99_02945 [Oscillospiraceae bacterium CM]